MTALTFSARANKVRAEKKTLLHESDNLIAFKFFVEVPSTVAG